MKLMSTFVLSTLLVLGAENSFAQTAKKSKTTKSKATTSKTVKSKEKVSPETETKVETETTTTTDTVTDPTTPIPPSAEFTAPAEPVTPPTTPPPVPNEDTSMRGGSHLFGLEAGVGLPQFLRGGLVYVHSSQMFSVEANVGGFSTSMSGATAKLSNLQAGLRWHPFSGSFFAGALFGNHSVTAEKKEIISAQEVTFNAELKASYVAPYVGWLWGADDGGFIAGMDIGLFNPSGAKATITTNAAAPAQADPEYQKNINDMQEVMKKLGETSLPMWTLFKIGYLF